MGQDNPSQTNQRQRLINLTLAAVSGSVGCLTLVIVLAAVLVGLQLDNMFHTRPVMTIVLVLGSIPVSLVAMLVVVRLATSKIKAGVSPRKEDKPPHEGGIPPQNWGKQEEDIGGNSKETPAG